MFSLILTVLDESTPDYVGIRGTSEFFRVDYGSEFRAPGDWDVGFRILLSMWDSESSELQSWHEAVSRVKMP